MSVLIKFNKNKKGPDGLYKVSGHHNDPEQLPRFSREKFDIAIERLPEPEQKVDYNHAIFGDPETGRLFWYEAKRDDSGDLGEWYFKLDINKEIVREKVKEYRDSVIEQGKEVTIGIKNYVFKTDYVSRLLLSQACNDLEDGKDIRWKTSKAVGGGDRWVTLNKDKLEFIKKEINNFIEECFYNEEKLEKEIEETKDLNELEKVDITSGWPR